MNKKKLLLPVCVLLLAGATTMISISFFSAKHQYTSRKTKLEIMPSNGARGYLNYIQSIRANQVTGDIDLNDVLNAEAQANAMAYNKTSALSMTWKEVGPDNVGGRTRSILIDRNNPNRMYAGSVSGGLWISDDVGANWRPYNDMLQTLIISCITQAPNGDIYFGTGEYSYPGRGVPGDKNSGFQGQGIFKSTDNGKTFTRLSSTWDALNVVQKTQWTFINQIATDPKNPKRIYVATHLGFRLSNDSGATWITNVKLSNGGTMPSGITSIASDVQVASDGTVIVCIGSNLYKSADGSDGSYARISAFPSGGKNYKFAIAPSNSNYIYCSAIDGNNTLKNIYQSTDKGETWKVIGPGGSIAFDPFAGFSSKGAIEAAQGDYDNTIAVDPSNPERIFVGGIDLYSWSSKNGWLEIANQFNDYSSNQSSNQYYVHADKHTIKFHPTNPNICFIGTDGGIFGTRNAGDKFPTFQTWTKNAIGGIMNKGYKTTQFYSVACSGDGKDIIGGTQDNGTQYIDGKGNTSMSAHSIRGGDGGYTEISVINPNAFFTGVYYGNLARSSNKGITSANFYDTIINPDNPNMGVNAGFAAFVTPFSLWENLNDASSPDSVLFKASPVTQQSIGVGDGIKVKFTGTLMLPQQSAKIDSIKIYVDNLVVRGNGNGNLTGDVSSTDISTINYTTGAYNLTFKTAPSKGMFIKADYNVSYDAGATLKIKSATSDFPFFYTLPSILNSNDSTMIQDVVQTKFAVGLTGSVWITKGALNFKTTPKWFKIANVNGEAHSMRFSKDGNYLFVGVGAFLYRISGLSSISSSQNTSGNKYDLTTSGIGQVKDTLIYTVNTGQIITDVAIDPNNNDRVIVTLGNYGNTNYVLLSTDATSATPTFSSIQNNLPKMPVYDAIFDKTNNNRIILGTDMGIFASDDKGTTWTEQNNGSGMPRVPVFMLRQQTNDYSWNAATGKYPVMNHGVIYAATHGRGIFMCDDYKVVGIDEQQAKNNSSNTYQPSIHIYPNPVQNNSVISFNLSKPTDDVMVRIYSLQGKLVKTINLPHQVAGNNQFVFDSNDLYTGTYFVNLSAGEISTTAKFVVVK